MSQLQPLLPYLARYRPALAGMVLMIIVGTLLSLSQPRLLGMAVDSLQSGHPGDRPYWLAAGIVALAAVQGGFTFGMRFVSGRISRRVEYEMRRDLFGHLERLPQSFFGEMHTGDLMARATNDLSAVRMLLGPAIMNSVNTGILFLIAAWLMFALDWQLAAIAVIALPLVSVAFTVIGRMMHVRYERVQAQFGAIATRAQENFSGIRVVKAYAQEDYEITRFQAASQEYVERNMAYQRLSGLLWPFTALVSGITAALILYLGSSEVIVGHLTLGRFIEFNGYLAILSWPMIAFGWTVNLYQQGVASLGRVSKVMNEPAIIADGPDTLPISAIKGDIEFRDVSLAYGGRPVLEGLSFHVPAGHSLAILGATGVGKTSIVNLICRVHEAQAGQVLIDGTDVRRIPLAVLRGNIGLVPQDTFLFSLSLHDNVAFGVEQPEPRRLAQAVTVARLSNDIDQFPGGLDTVIGERGVTLSGGQKQRTAIARAVMRDPAILILDDALSSIDTQTQAQILSGLGHVLAGRTSILIAHRISTVKAADHILVLDDGRVAEEGTHTDLVARGGLYAQMYRRELLTQELQVDEV
ncbi:MAG: ABC transporter ATP-binding protein/permease [Chloroflexota bacterium]|nr:ABC transporter ATP-binding protein/permease [Chloroflexota bacterium]